MASINMPKGRDLGTEYSKTLSAQIGMLPNLLGAQQEFAPLQAAGQLSNLSTMLLGTPGGSYETNEYTPAVYRQGGDYSYGRIPPGMTGYISYPHLPDNVPSSGSSGGGNNWWQNFLPPIPGLSGAGGGGMSGFLPKSATVTGGYPGAGAGTGTMGMAGGKGRMDYPAKGKGFNISGGGNMIPGSPGSINGVPLPPAPDPITGQLIGGLLGMFGGGNNGPPRRLVSPSGWQTVTHQVGPQRGLLDIYTKDIGPAMGNLERQQMSAQRAGDVADFAQYGPGAVQAFQGMDPATAALVGSLTSTANSDLSYGTGLDPASAAMLQRSMRGAQAARGMGYGPADAYNESLGMLQMGQQLKQQRMATASGVAGLRDALYGAPARALLGRPGSGTGSTFGAANQAMGLGGGQGNFLSFLNPESSYAQDLYNTNFNTLVNQAIGNANNQNALIGAGISAFGQMAGGAMKAFGA